MLWLCGELAVGDLSITGWIGENYDLSYARGAQSVFIFFVYMGFVFNILLGMLVGIIIAAFDSAKTAVQEHTQHTHDTLLAQVTVF